MGRTPADIKDIRRRQVRYYFFVENKTQREIGEILKWNEQTIHDDLLHIKKQMQAEVKDGEQILFKMLETSKKMFDDAYLDYKQAVEIREKRLARLELQAIKKDLIDLLLKTGVLRSAPTEQITLNVDITPEQFIKQCLTIEADSTPKQTENL